MRCGDLSQVGAWLFLGVLAVGCAATELTTDDNHPANPAADSPRLPEGSGVLDADFEPAKAYGITAPKGGGHHHHHMGAPSAAPSAEPRAAPSASAAPAGSAQRVHRDH